MSDITLSGRHLKGSEDCSRLDLSSITMNFKRVILLYGKEK